MIAHFQAVYEHGGRDTLSIRRVEVSSGSGVWDEYVQRHPDATSAHSFGWLRVMRRSFGHTCHPLAVTNGSGTVRGVLPLVLLKSSLFGTFLVSMPFLNNGGLLADGEAEADLLLEEAENLRRELRSSHVELRHGPTPLPSLPTRSHKVCMTLTLSPSEDEQWRALDCKVRNQVRKAGKNGLRTVIGGTELLDGFYNVFAHNMRDLGTPVYSRNFFAHVLEEFSDSSRLVMVMREDTPVAGAVTLWNRGVLEVPWASSLREYNSLCPNNLLYWEAIRLAIGLGMHTLDFGRSTPGGGTHKFKAQWGAVPHALHWQYLLAPGRDLPDITPTNPRYHAAISLWKRLPVPLTKAIGPLLSRSIP